VKMRTAIIAAMCIATAAGALAQTAGEQARRRCAETLDGGVCRAALRFNLGARGNAEVRTLLAIANEDPEGEPSKREALLREAIRLDPTYPLAAFTLAQHIAYAKPAEAIALLRNVLKLRPQWLAAREALALVLQSTGQLKEAADVLAADPSRHVSAPLAQTLLNAGRVDEARAAYSRLAATEPATAAHWLSLGEAQAKSGQREEARASYRRVLTIAKVSSVDLRTAGHGLRELDAWSDAADAFARAVDVDPRFTPNQWVKLDPSEFVPFGDYRHLQVARVDALEKSGRNAEAAQVREATLQRFREVVARQPDAGVLWGVLGETQIEFGSYEDALATYDRGVNLQPDWTGGRLCRAGALVGLKRYHEATEAVRALTERQPDDRSLLATLRWVTEIEGRIDDALGLHRRLLPEISNGMSSICVNTWPDYGALAPQYLERARLAPDDPFIEGAAGLALELAGRDDESIAAYRRAVAKDPKAPWARILLGCDLSRNGRYQEAIDVLTSLQSDAELLKRRPDAQICFETARTLLTQGAK
jgi:tetratricopeptide (TPR) repeat protein